MMLRDTADWRTAHDVRATAPKPGEEGLRSAYLSLLKLSLCDLAGTTTQSVGLNPDGTVHTRELAGEQRGLRACGMDWPLQGLTMAGLKRLDDLQACVEAVVADGVEGDLVETGAWRGGASILMRATLDALGATDRTVVVCDSFAGFPADAAADGLDAVDFLVVPREEVEASFERLGCREGVRFVEGLFEDTMPGLADGRWAIVRLDGDSYEATRTTLEALYPGLAVGGHLIVDDYGALDECRRAVDEFRARNGIEEPLEVVDWTCVRWRRASGAGR
jgi:O-methyltransferase